MENWRVPLPPAVRSPFVVYVNGVRQQAGSDYRVEAGALVFERELVREGKLGFWAWFWGAFGIGTYKRNDEVDVSWTDAEGHPRVAHALAIEPPTTGPGPARARTP